MSDSAELSRDFFPSLFLPIAYPGELLYSWCARFHRLSRNFHPQDTRQQLFGDRSPGTHFDFPSPLAGFLRRTGSHLGTVETLLLQRTLFGFYRSFLPEDRVTALREAIINGSYGDVHSTLGRVSSLATLNNLKGCVNCVAEDLATQSTSWWRTEHQWPCSFICHRHQKPLASLQSSIEQSKNAWILPQDAESQGGWANIPEPSPTVFSLLEKLTTWCRLVTVKSDIQLDTAQLRHCYLTEAEERGYVAMDGSVRLGMLRDDFLHWIGSCTHWPGLSFAGDVKDVNAGFIGQLLRSYPGVRHPLKHFVMMAFMFPSAEVFLTRYKEVSETYDKASGRKTSPNLTKKGKDLLRLVGEESISVSSAAEKLDVPVTQATRYLKKFKTPYLCRPRIVGTEKEDSLIQAFQAGKPRVEICRELGVRSSFIKGYLATRPALRETWEAKRTAMLRQEYRQHFLKVLAENPTLPIKSIRKLPQNGFQWLYNNDHDWLEEILPAIWKR